MPVLVETEKTISLSLKQPPNPLTRGTAEMTSPTESAWTHIGLLSGLWDLFSEIPSGRAASPSLGRSVFRLLSDASIIGTIKGNPSAIPVNIKIL
ncbi:hypothetical protein ES703_56782 [subsurface metagenome]